MYYQAAGFPQRVSWRLAQDGYSVSEYLLHECLFIESLLWSVPLYVLSRLFPFLSVSILLVIFLVCISSRGWTEKAKKMSQKSFSCL